MKLSTLTLASAAVALLGGVALAQPQPAAAPTPGSVTGDWNGAHAPSDDKQYKSKVVVPVAELPSSVASTSAAEPPAEPVVSATSTPEAPAAPAAAADVSATAPSFSSITVTNGPVPDTKENRAKYGQPLSATGRRTAARGN